MEYRYSISGDSLWHYHHIIYRIVV